MREQHALNTGRKGTELQQEVQLEAGKGAQAHRSKALNESQWHERKNG